MFLSEANIGFSKKETKAPEIVRDANITSIYKNKGERNEIKEEITDVKCDMVTVT